MDTEIIVLMAAAVAVMFGLMAWVIKALGPKISSNGTKFAIGHLKNLLEDKRLTLSQREKEL